MAYHPKVIAKIKSQPTSLGNRLGRWAVHHDLPVTKITAVIGATRPTIYNWMNGGDVFTAYRPAVTKLVQILEQSKTADEAWRNICKAFDLKT